MNWEDHMSKFNLPHAKLLYLIYYLSKSGALDKQQTIKLKEYVILEDERIFQILTEFETHHDMDALLDEFKKVYEDERKYSFNKDDGVPVTNPLQGVSFVIKYRWIARLVTH
jgi:hypothetical protein